MPDLDLASHRRAVHPSHPKRGAYLPRIPRWTSHEPEGRADTTPKRVTTPLPKAWCYLCGSEHPWAEPCKAQERLMAEWAQRGKRRSRKKVAEAVVA